MGKSQHTAEPWGDESTITGEWTPDLERASVALFAQRIGWEIGQVSLFDEEGVEGWKWTHPDGTEYCAIGPWDDVPAVPDELEGIIGKITVPALAALKGDSSD